MLRKEEIIKRAAENIRLERERKNLTQEVLAEYAGISTKYMNMIENKKVNPSGVILIKICQVLDMELNKLQRNID